MRSEKTYSPFPKYLFDFKYAKRIKKKKKTNYLKLAEQLVYPAV